MGKLKPWRRRWKQALRADERYGYGTALMLARQYVRDFSEQPAAWYLLALNLRDLARYQDARNALRKMRRVTDTDRRDPYYDCAQWGRLCWAQRNFAQAAEWFARQIEARPNAPGGYLNLAQVRCDRGQYDSAARTLDQCPRAESHDLHDIYWIRGLIARAQGDLNEARRWLIRTRRFKETHLLNRWALRDVEEAVRWKKRFTLRSGAKRAREEARERLRAMKVVDKRWMPATGRLIARQVLDENQEDLVALDRELACLRYLRRFDDARKTLNVIRRLLRSRGAPMWYLYDQCGHLAEKKGAYRRAIEWYQRSMRSRPRDAAPHIYLGGAYARWGKLKTAERSFRDATRSHEGCIDEAYLNLGYALRAQERFVEARDSFRKALELEPRYPEAREALRDCDAALNLMKTPELQS